ncbi:MAG: hypothetical protein A2566_01920 [Candidatus Zambryskibacteria bacterium RIFOXYD1_FULL_40_13]|nr:MAG: hypothetical protein UT25_C0003G0100 [Parcubacteria group bacterium GW2011_GWC1_39_12]KKR18985.1 MAG: hypothetical protein UT49_C0005G0052 [Parcubacteria group bacterium GW2011_GWF1_39_37]KKR35460.1 MAG: hypothetical protein UT68_C0003G0031 [Parcubacteria group bacterium GW2011_GWC2_40_10]KKR51950.1 MAG: hypothetical protein UT89_C0004G0030 [Parcubacteria group bacterium GW2011_GWE1_40_20]KKR64964.1 MAG: hypothetical protein UU06_C0033G0003 [Parcubacteria group bacterium GW2011_GWB1_40_
MEFEKSSIERLKRTLYSRNENVVPKEKRTPVPERKIDISTDWGTTPSFDIPKENMTKHNNSFFNKFFIGSMIFFVVALAVAVFIFFGGLNMISSNNLDIKIVAPGSVSSGEELVVGLSILNSNRTDLEETTLFITYPDASLSVGEEEPLTREKVDLGVIPSGGSKDHIVRLTMSGEKDAIKSFNFRIEYRVKGSNATFSKEKKYDVIISSSPIILNVSYPKEINSGQTVAMVVDIVSNSSVVMKNTLVKVEYPYGFTFKDSSTKPIRDNTIWNIGDLKDGDKKSLTITGTLIGQNLEDRSFKVSVGTQKSSIDEDFDIALASNIVTVGIRKSFFDLTVTSESVSVIGRSIPVTIKWENILPDKILNTNITAVLSGNILDRNSVRVNNGGFYRSVDDTIVWDKNSTENLASISPGDYNSVSFSLSSLFDINRVRSIKNPNIVINIKSTGDRTGTESGVISSEEEIVIKFPSAVAFTAKSYRSIGPFGNSGPIPPKADKESTYTITWVLTNANNDLKDTLVTAVLPAGVEWKKEVSPSSERFTWSEETRVLTWNVGNIASGAGFTNSPKEISFKVGVTPSVSQIGSVLDLLTRINMTATDTYTNTQLTAGALSVTTQFSDPTYKSTDGFVVQ